MKKRRCCWAENASPIDIQYHDEEWGVPVYDDLVLFEFLVLEGMQAGLSWSTILRRRQTMKRAFDNYDLDAIIQYDEKKIATLLQDTGIIRNRLKINAVITNAKLFLEIQKEFGSFATYLWGFVDYKPIVNHWLSKEEVPITTTLSDTISKDLKKRGFKFVGSTIIYAYLQAVGVVSDHEVSCFCYTKEEDLENT